MNRYLSRRNSIITILSVGLLGLWFTATTRAEGLLYTLPEDGTWATYDMVIDLAYSSRDEDSIRGTLTISSVGTEVVDNQACRWIEFTQTIENKERHAIETHKVLIPEVHLAPGQEPLKHVVRFWWQHSKFSSGKPVLITDQTDEQRQQRIDELARYLHSPFPTSIPLEAETIECQLGKLTCEGLEASETLNVSNLKAPIPATYRIFRHEKAPFGVVRWKGKFEFADENGPPLTLTQNLLLVETGRNAVTKISDAGDSAANNTPPAQAAVPAKLAPVATAIHRGVEYLKSKQQENGAWEGKPVEGVTALCLAALMQSGVPADDSVIQKGLASLRNIQPELSYSVALQTAVFSMGSPRLDAELIQRNLAWLEKAQVADGKARGSWGYAADPKNRGDGSCTRFAVFGLEAAERAGFKVKQETWIRVSDYWLDHQRADGSWGYMPEAPPTLSMTLAGIEVLATANRYLPEDEQSRKREAAMQKAAEYASRRLPSILEEGFPFCALHSVARAGAANTSIRFGNINRQEFVSRLLCESQHKSGFWKTRAEDELIATSLGLLVINGLGLSAPNPPENPHRVESQKSEPDAKRLLAELRDKEELAAREAARIRQLHAANLTEAQSAKLQELLSAAFDLKLQVEELQIHELQEQLKRLQKQEPGTRLAGLNTLQEQLDRLIQQLEKRKEKRPEILQRRARQLLEQPTSPVQAPLSIPRNEIRR